MHELAADRAAATILLVEDHVGTARSLSRLLEHEGYDVVWARHGMDAIERLTEHRPHLIITDLDVPLLSGRELVERVRQNPTLKQVPVIVYSAFEGHDRPKLERLGVKRFIRKGTTDFPWMLRQVREVLTHRNMPPSSDTAAPHHLPSSKVH